MAAGENWSAQEVRATVVDYMAMLRFEMLGQPYNKSKHRRALLEALSGRSEAAVEMKHQNISAVLRDLGYFWIPGYQPLPNYQRSVLVDEVESWVRTHPDIDRYATIAAEAPAATPEHFDFDSFESKRPARREQAVHERQQAGYGEQSTIRLRCDYAAREARNSSLGLAGEELIVKFEQHRLAHLGLDRLADKVRHISKLEGDGAGFDVLSFDRDGGERFIEVKTTAFARETPFYASAAEVRFSAQNAPRYQLCRLFDFRKKPKCYTLPGKIEDHCVLDPISYRCAVA